MIPAQLPCHNATIEARQQPKQMIRGGAPHIGLGSWCTNAEIYNTLQLAEAACGGGILHVQCGPVEYRGSAAQIGHVWARSMTNFQPWPQILRFR